MTAGTTAADIYGELRAAIARGAPSVVVTIVKGEGAGAKLLFAGNGQTGSLGSATLDERAVEYGRELLQRERSETVTWPVGHDALELFFDVHPAPPTLLIFGAVHVAQSLSALAKRLGFRVIVTDARATLATEERFPDADEIVQAWPDDAMARIEITPTTYVAILTHDPKFDEPALLSTLGTNAGYIGAVGSRTTSIDRRQRLIDAGVQEDQIARIRGPIGLDIGAETPEEMAIAILAEIIAVRHGRHGGSLAKATGNIRGEQNAGGG